jgi:hypothetical protein
LFSLICRTERQSVLETGLVKHYLIFGRHGIKGKSAIGKTRERESTLSAASSFQSYTEFSGLNFRQAVRPVSE